MAWKAEVEKQTGQFPFKGVSASSNGRKQEAGQFEDEKHARDYAVDLSRMLNFSEKPVVIVQQPVAQVETEEVQEKAKTSMPRRKK